MDYTLPDGTVIELGNIHEVSDIKDYGSDETTISESTLCFTIRFKEGHSIKVSQNYHYSDWFDVFRQLKAVRSDILEKWNRIRNQDI